MKVAIHDAGYEGYEQEEAVFATAGMRLTEHLEEADGILLRYQLVDAEWLAALPKLQAIVRYGVGYDNIDVSACTARSVRVANVSGYANESVSDHALGLILACSRNLRAGMEQLRDNYCQPPRRDNFELTQKTLGVIGLGNIGSTLARKAAPLFRRIIACDPNRPGTSVERLELNELLAESDVISVHCDLNPSSHQLIDEAAFAAMKTGAILVNTSRGEVVDSEALFAAMESGRLHSLGIDVFPDEPPGPRWDRLLADPRVVATGHYAWHSLTAMRNLQHRAACNMVALLSGQPPTDWLNRDAL